jgi:outer membrane receptor protein involved in Fe transport
VTLDLIAIPLTVSVYGKNILNRHYADAIQEGLSLGGVVQTPGDPRTYGVTIKYRFGG